MVGEERRIAQIICSVKAQPLPTPTQQSFPSIPALHGAFHPANTDLAASLHISGNICLQREIGTRREQSCLIKAALGCYGRAAGA